MDDALYALSLQACSFRGHVLIYYHYIGSSQKDLDKLSKLGHFLKGSSASIGLVAVSKSCAAMQNYGSLLDESGSDKIDSTTALSKCADLLKTLKVDQEKAKKWLMDFYKEEW
jgi:osomolarity two-component system phosphorelay intermediate protein YPD1